MTYSSKDRHKIFDQPEIRSWALRKGLSVGARGRMSLAVLDAYLAEYLVLGHMDAADSVAVSVWKTAPYALQLDELKAISYIALVTAGNRWVTYCREKGYSPSAIQFFKPFAQRRIRGAIYDEFRTADWASRTLRSRSKMLQGAGQQTGASVENMAESTGLSIDAVKSTIQGMSRKPVSLDSNDHNLYEQAKENVEGSVLAKSLMNSMVDRMSKLVFLQQLVVALKYHQNMTMKDISEELEIPVTVISQEHAAAIYELKNAMAQEAGDFNG